MIRRYVWADLVRNPRRTLSTVSGVALGIGLACAVLFFVDGLSASMTQRAVAPVPIDMQRVLTAPVGVDLVLDQRVSPAGKVGPGALIDVELAVANRSERPAHEVTVRAVPPAATTYVASSTTLDGRPVVGNEDPLATGPAKAGLNLGAMAPATAHVLRFRLQAQTPSEPSASLRSTVSSREALSPIPAAASRRIDLTDLAARVARVDGVAFAEPLLIADLGPGALQSDGRTTDTGARVFGMRPSYVARDPTVRLVAGSPAGGALVSAEAAARLALGVGDQLTLTLPDATTRTVTVGGVVDLTQARALFASRKGADLETFVYVKYAVVVDPATFDDVVRPAFERAATSPETGALKGPPIREVDVGVDRGRLDADPGAALRRTRAIAAAVSAVAAQPDFLIDNISNTLAVARQDSALAKRMFLFLGLPGGVLAAVLAGYAGNVLAAAQRREQAILRTRGASRRHLLRMLALRVAAITGGGAVVGVAAGYLTARVVVGRDLGRTTAASLTTSGVVSTAGGLLATGLALYVTGRRSIDREIDEDRRRLTARPPLWRRLRLDLVGLAAVAAGTAVAVAGSAFAGTPGSVYVGRAVHLPLALLALPLGVWAAGCLLGARLTSVALRASRPRSARFYRLVPALYRRSVARRPWAVADGVIAVGLIVALGTSLAVFTASYDAAKLHDSRFVTGGDLRITPRPESDRRIAVQDATTLAVDGVAAVTPVVYGVHNAVVRSARTSDVANLAAFDPAAYARTAPLDPFTFPHQASPTAGLALLRRPQAAVLVSRQFAAFLQARVGDTVGLILARGTAAQVTADVVVAGIFTRLAGFPDGADAAIDIRTYAAAVGAATPDFFLARTTHGDAAALRHTAGELRSSPLGDDIAVATRATALAKDQSSLAALNIRGLVSIDSGYGLAMSAVAVGIFVFGLLLQRRREYITLRSQGLAPRSVRALVAAEAATVAAAGSAVGVAVGLAMAVYFVRVLRALFVLAPPVVVPRGTVSGVVAVVVVATTVAAVAGSLVLNRLRPTELLRDE